MREELGWLVRRNDSVAREERQKSQKIGGKGVSAWGRREEKRGYEKLL